VGGHYLLRSVSWKTNSEPRTSEGAVTGEAGGGSLLAGHVTSGGLVAAQLSPTSADTVSTNSILFILIVSSWPPFKMSESPIYPTRLCTGLVFTYMKKSHITLFQPSTEMNTVWLS
jgi:hypothetical protein